MSQPEVMVYTDGACLGNPGPGGWGVRVLYAEGMVCERGGAVAATTNNRMELQAAIVALQEVAQRAPVVVHTDSRYVIDGCTQWLAAWRRRGWVTTTQTPVKNRDLWMTLESLLHAGVSWQHVYGHRGHPQNERVDTIARGYAAGQPPALFCGRAGAPDDPVVLSASGAIIPAQAPGLTWPQGTVRYVSLVRGQLVLDRDWPACAARVHGVAGARYRKVRTREELAGFCTTYGVPFPSDIRQP